jgi:hemerythrin-like domain-containing protein
MGCHAAATSPTAVLRAEHRVIESALDVLDALARRASISHLIDVPAGFELVDFFRTFADKCHHGKEESILFPALEKRFPGFGPGVVMRHEHVEGRELVAFIRDAIERADAAAFIRHAKTFSSHLRAHIQKEDHCRWPMADQILDEEARAEVLAAFERAEIEHVGPGVHERMLAVLDDLRARLGLGREATSLLAKTGCGCSGARDSSF